MTTLDALFIAKSVDLLTVEYRTKLHAAVHAIPAERLWLRPNEGSNSVANLLLHLAGNLRQWIVSGVGGSPDARHRSAEFEARDGGSASELLAQLDATVDEAVAVIRSLDAEALARPITVQGRDVTVLEAVYHVCEHFALHLGQIIFVAKQLAPGAIKFYEDAGGLAVPVWKELRRR